MVLGVGETVIGKYLNGVRGLTATLPFLLIVLVLIVKGSALPQRGELVYSNMPLAPPVHRVPEKVGVFAVVSVVLLFWLPSSYSAAFSIALLGGVIILSLVVIVGWVGQISLCQVGFTGVGAYATVRIANHLSIGFPFSIVLGALVAVPIGVLVGLPALRVRGVNLAVVTLGAGIALERMVFNNPSFTGGSQGSAVPTGAELFGVDLDGRTEPGAVRRRHPRRAVPVRAAAREPAAQRVRGAGCCAVRADETAAAASGINVAKVKLQAFALSAFVAALAGGLMAYRAGRVSESGFVVFQSINFFSLAYIGGIATIGGGAGRHAARAGRARVRCGCATSSGRTRCPRPSRRRLIVTVITQPDGVANVVRHEREKRRMKAARAARAAGTRGA
jgi:ABC-type branched-subunit amino acid transport system permease subunit